MPLDSARSDISSNVLLSLLPEQDQVELAALLQWVPTPHGMCLAQRDAPLKYAYFPCGGEHSVLAVMESGSMVEVGTIGREGMSNVELLIGSEVALETTVCQIPGESLRMPADDLRAALDRMPALRRITQRYLQAYLAQVSQSVACNRLHNIGERFARWVLMSHDRVHGDEFQLTQEYLAAMLGVHRPSVSIAAQAFQNENLIRYSRGVMTVLDRPGLEAASCECYFTVRAHYRRLLGVDIG